MMNAYTLLSELYRLLGVVDDDTLRGAEKMALPPEMRAIIEAISVAKNHGLPAPPVPPTPADSADQPKLPATAASSFSPDLTFLLDARAMPNRRLADLLSRSGIPVRMRERESRVSLLEKAERILRYMPDAKRKQVLDKLYRLAGIDETSGWMSVIHSDRKK